MDTVPPAPRPSVRTPVGIKMLGADLAQRIAAQVEAAVASVPGTRSAFAERVTSGAYLDFELKRDQLARYGLSVDDANEEIVEALVHGAVKRVRPKAMTVCAAMLGLLPIMWATGTGSDVMKRIAAPMVGGLVTSFLLELLVYPAVYLLWLERPRAREPSEHARLVLAR